MEHAWSEVKAPGELVDPSDKQGAHHCVHLIPLHCLQVVRRGPLPDILFHGPKDGVDVSVIGRTGLRALHGLLEGGVVGVWSGVHEADVRGEGGEAGGGELTDYDILGVKLRCRRHHPGCTLLEPVTTLALLAEANSETT